MQYPILRAAALLSLATLCWGANITLGRAVHLEIPPVGLSFWRWAIAFFLLLLFNWKAMTAARGQLKEAWRTVFLLSLIGMAAFHTTLYLAVNFTTAINAALIMSTAPIMVPALSWLIDRENVSQAFLLGLCISLLGAGAVVTRLDFGALSSLSLNSGDLLMFAAAFLWSLYTVLLRRRPKGLSPSVLLTAMTGFTTVTILPFYLAETIWIRPVLINWTTFWVLGYVSLFASIVAFFAFNRGIELIGPNKGGMFLHLIPLWAALLAVLFLGEVLELHHLVAAVMIASGIFLAFRGSTRGR